MAIKIKICGMKFSENINEIASLQPDYLGFIFYEKSLRNFENNIPFGDSYEYYQNGEIKKYKCYDFKGELAYISTYDNIGTLVKEDGQTLIQFNLNTENDFENVKINM